MKPPAPLRVFAGAADEAACHGGSFRALESTADFRFIE